MKADLIEQLRRDEQFNRNVRFWHVQPAREGRYAPVPPALDSRLHAALRARGIEQLYSHQSAAVEHALARRNVVIVTPTASGKTLTYNLPVLDTILRNPNARALYLFPTKALSQDQQAELNLTVESGALPVKIVTFDGDTPPAIRSSARTTGGIIISNPDMLHTGILPNHPRWSQFFQNLQYVVIDELHSYRGIFGAHVTNVVRRLKRIAAFYGATPRFILCSATIGNPRELAEAIVEEPVELVAENGAPAGEKHFVLYNPPVVDRVQGIRQGVAHAAQQIAVRFLKAGVKTIVFTRSRQRVELVADYIRSQLANVYTDNSRIRVESYRGGYLPNERRAIERGLRDGSIHGVVSTNALELGIDIGGLDAAVLGGWPGTVAAALQQSGRAGRRQTRSIAVLVASSAPLDQYVIEHPEYILERNPEHAYTNPDNPYVLYDHLKCAVFELPFDPTERFGNAEVADHLEALEESGVIRFSAGNYHWADRSYPAEAISLRSATSDNVVIVDTTGGANEVIGEMDRPSAKELIFDNAIYLHRGTQFVVKKLDIENRRCEVERSDVNYFTDALLKLDIKVLTEDESSERIGARLVLGDVLVRSVAAKFKKIRFHTHENVGYGEIDLPEEQMHTRAVVVVLPAGTAGASGLETLESAARAAALNRFARLVRNVAPVFLMCAPADIGVSAAVRDPHFEAPALFLYDRYPGGSGLAESFVPLSEHIVSAALERLRGCACESGCPSCVGPEDPSEGYSGNPKAAVRTLTDAWFDGAGR